MVGSSFVEVTRETFKSFMNVAESRNIMSQPVSTSGLGRPVDQLAAMQYVRHGVLLGQLVCRRGQPVMYYVRDEVLESLPTWN